VRPVQTQWMLMQRQRRAAKDSIRHAAQREARNARLRHARKVQTAEEKQVSKDRRAAAKARLTPEQHYSQCVSTSMYSAKRRIEDMIHNNKVDQALLTDAFYEAANHIDGSGAMIPWARLNEQHIDPRWRGYPTPDQRVARPFYNTPEGPLVRHELAVYKFEDGSFLYATRTGELALRVPYSVYSVPANPAYNVVAIRESRLRAVPALHDNCVTHSWSPNHKRMYLHDGSIICQNSAGLMLKHRPLGPSKLQAYWRRVDGLWCECQVWEAEVMSYSNAYSRDRIMEKIWWPDSSVQSTQSIFEISDLCDVQDTTSLPFGHNDLYVDFYYELRDECD